MLQQVTQHGIVYGTQNRSGKVITNTAKALWCWDVAHFSSVTPCIQPSGFMFSSSLSNPVSTSHTCAAAALYVPCCYGAWDHLQFESGHKVG